jgi:DNA-binding transcriptional regulator YiaG
MSFVWKTDSQKLRLQFMTKGIYNTVVLEDLQAMRQAKGYSIHMVAEMLNISVDSYLELEYSVREASDQEMNMLDIIFSE